MYICNRCGCSAMAEIGKKLTCLNCGNEQPKALSRKRSSCVPNTPRHNSQTVKHVDAKASAAAPVRPASQRPAATPRKPAKKPLPKVLLWIFIAILLINIIPVVLYGVVSEVTQPVSSEESWDLPEMEEIEFDWEEEEYEPDEFRYIEQTPWYYINAEGTMLFDDYTYFAEGNRERDLYLPDVLLDFQVSKIGYDAFLFCEGIETITVPDSVKVIETDAFYGCEDLREIWLPDSITHIYYDAVYDCPDLEAIYYAGTAEQWDAIYIEDPNEQLNQYVVFLTE